LYPGDGDGGVATETAGATRDAGAGGGTELLVKLGGCRLVGGSPSRCRRWWRRLGRGGGDGA